MLTEDKHLIPTQSEGASSDTSSSATFSSDDDARQFFNVVRSRLLNVNEWEKRAGMATANFILCDASGKEVSRDATEGDHFKIDIPGPGTVTGEGYDWVKLESIKEAQEGNSEAIVLTVRPATNPNNERSDVAHFFDDSATSSFIIERVDNIVTASVKGRNEKPNTHTEKVLDTARNTAIAAAAITGFSKIQWKGLTDGLVKPE